MSRTSVALAAALAVGAAGWIASGMLASGEAQLEPPPQAVLQAPLVEVASLSAREVDRFVNGQGDVQAFRKAAARSQSAGRVAELLVDRGQRVEEGEPLLRLTLEGLDSRLREAEAVRDRRQRDYEAQERLQAQGYATAAQLRELETLLQSAREEVARFEEQIGDTVIRAPFSGQVDAIAVEIGEYVAANTDVVVVVENVPLRTIVRVSQLDRSKIVPGREVEVAYATGQTERGLVCFVSAAADPGTRTFAVEVRTPNAGGAIPSGISAEVTIPVDTVPAHFVSPAILSLGTDGTLGLKTADEEGRVGFHPVDVIRADAAGLWVTGLPREARVITLGQGFVKDGDVVRVSEAGEADAGPATRQAAAAGAVPADLCARAPGIEGAALSAAPVRGDAS